MLRRIAAGAIITGAVLVGGLSFSETYSPFGIEEMPASVDQITVKQVKWCIQEYHIHHINLINTDYELGSEFHSYMLEQYHFHGDRCDVLDSFGETFSESMIEKIASFSYLFIDGATEEEAIRRIKEYGVTYVGDDGEPHQRTLGE